jgi:hypothetical protein
MEDQKDYFNMKKNKNIIEVLFLEDKLTYRNCDAIPCPKCLGYCEKTTTKKKRNKTISNMWKKL